MVEVDRTLAPRYVISTLVFILLVSSASWNVSVSALEPSPPLENTIKTNLTHGMVYSTYSSQVLGLQNVSGSQWWVVQLLNRKDETGELIHSPKIIVQTPMTWNEIRSVNPTNVTMDVGTERIYAWQQGHLVQGKTLEAKICSRNEMEFSLPFDSFRSFNPEIISEKYVFGTLIVKVVPQINALPNSFLTLTIEAGETPEVAPELLEHTFFLQNADTIHRIDPMIDPNRFQLRLEKWKKQQEISIQMDVRLKNKLYHPDSNVSRSIRYIPSVQIAYTEMNEDLIEHSGNNIAYRVSGLGKLVFSANGTYHWLTEGPSPHTTRIVWYQQISAPTELLVEIEIEKFYLQNDKDPGEGVGEVYFEITPANMTQSFRAPEFGYEETLFQTHSPRPGPMFIPESPLSFPIHATIEAFERDSSTVENLTEVPQTITINTFEELLSSRPHIFNLSDIYFEVVVRPATRIRDPYARYSEVGTKNLTMSLPDDEFLHNQWYWFEIGCDRVWTSYEATNFTEVIVAVVDTGVDFTHPDLRNRILRDSQRRVIGRNTLKDNDNIMDDTPTGHGTMMAGIIAAEANNSQFFAGIAPNARIMPIKVVSRNGASHASDVAEGINFAVNHGADIISVSIGSYLTSDVVQTAIFNAYNHGILVIAAVGNERTTKATIPADYQETLAVTGVRRLTDHIVFADMFSNYGPDLTSTPRSPWISAPAVNIWSTNTTMFGNVPIGVASGTSFATPIVSAAAALILGYANHKQIDASPELIWWLLQASAADLGPNGWDPYYGYGLVNVSRALELINSLGNITISTENSMTEGTLQLDAKSQHYMFSSRTTAESRGVIPRTVYSKENPQRLGKSNKFFFSL